MTAEQMPAVTRAMAYAAGRYGHVLFPETVSQPALTLAQKLLAGPGQGWATRVFYSDDGSTAVEVAIKMAFRKYMADHGLMDKSEQELAKLNFSILGLSGSYHGDTLGAMDAQSPSVFTGFKQMPWYQPRGVWIDPPTLYLSEGLWQGVWQVELPAAISDGHQTSSPISSKEVDVKFSSKADALDMLKRKASPLKTAYLAYINSRLDAAQAKGTQVAACVMESTMHGAGGMDMIDPLFQLAMATVARERRIPVVMDEVFAGLWRLGRLSGCSFSGVVPDIACYAKLLTGGTLPLAATLATEQAFRGPSKTDALLHGHSYTAHPIGCQAGVAALDLMASRRVHSYTVHPIGCQAGVAALDLMASR
ncbi:pyridoxal phosphate-dependent transferase [Baffinella frigidus]|nr:pyridoxal phosphate-dependent transferase [Cryptophyta sp. CCMP2293]